MATALLSYELTTNRTLALPAVWRRKDGYLLAATIVLEISLTTALMRLTDYLRGEWVSNVMMGALFGQCFLLGLWGALGGLRAVPRWLLIGATWIAGTLALEIATEAPYRWEAGLDLPQLLWQKLVVDVLGNLFEVLVFGGLIISGFACLLLPLRRLAGWRIDFDPAYYRSATGRTGQAGLMDIAALMCACALPMSLIRLVMNSEEVESGEILMLPVMIAAIAPTAAAAAWAVLARRRVSWWLAAAALWTIAMSWFHSLGAQWTDALDFFNGSQRYWGLCPQVLLLHASIAGVVVVTLGGLRLCGLSLIVVGGQILTSE